MGLVPSPPRNSKLLAARLGKRWVWKFMLSIYTEQLPLRGMVREEGEEGETHSELPNISLLRWFKGCIDPHFGRFRKARGANACGPSVVTVPAGAETVTVEPFKQLQPPHLFKLTRENGEVVLHYKIHAQSLEWMPRQGGGIKVAISMHMYTCVCVCVHVHTYTCVCMSPKLSYPAPGVTKDARPRPPRKSYVQALANPESKHWSH